MGQIIEFLAFIELRRSHESMHRPYRIPVNFAGSIALMSLPLLFIVLIFFLSALKTVIFAVVAALLGIVAYYLIEMAKERKWCEFEHMERNHSVGSISDDADIYGLYDLSSSNGSKEDSYLMPNGASDNRYNSFSSS